MEVKKEEDVPDAIDAFQKQKFRSSLQSVIHKNSSRKWDDYGMHVKVKPKFGEGLQTLMKNAKNMDSLLKKKQPADTNSPIFGDFVLPGCIYLLHPYIANGEAYMHYEQAKSTITSVMMNWGCKA